MKRLLYKALPVILSAVLIIFSAKAQDKNISKFLYIASAIPDSLKEDANSVVRYSMEDMEVRGPGKASVKTHSIVTVLNEKGNEEAMVALQYSRKFNAINSFEMKVYNADGVLLKKYHKSDMYDRSAINSETILTDDRVLYFSHSIANYPCTIETIVEEDRKSWTDLGGWGIQHDDQSIENSSYRITIDKDAGFRYLNKNTNITPVKATNGSTDIYQWTVKNLKAFKVEEHAQGWQVLPAIYFSANNFEFYGLNGEMTSWQNFGKWIQSLNADVNTLTPKRAEELRAMTANLPNDKAKAKFLYEYMQHNMRYVSVQLGIGGLKPFPASFVDEKKYGDCKALSNYMYAMLKAVNIPSYYAIIRAGANERPATASFPYNSFNHVVLCVPFKNDTTWLECTSNTQSFGKLGSFTENRNALLITEEGGKLVNTPKSNCADNQFNSEVRIVLDADGSAKAKVKILSTGEYRSDYIGMTSMKTDEQKEYLIRVMNMKQPRMFEYTLPEDKDGVKELDMDLDYDKFADIAAGNKIFYRPRVFDLWQATLPVLEKRKADFFFDHPMQKSCVTTIELPAGFEVETLPANQSLKFSYGNYDVSYAYDAAKNQVVSTAKFILNNHIIPAAKYTEMQVYMDNIAKAQNKKLVIKRKA